MTTAHELPEPVAPARGSAVPAVPAHEPRPVRRGGLAAVPDLVGDEGPISFDQALGRAAPRLRRYAVRRIGDAHEAEEIVQEALLRACQHAPGFRTEDDLMAWTTVVTGRLVIDRVRVRTRSVSMPEIPEGSRCGRDTADVVVARDEARAALDALESMPSRQAGVLWAREVEGLSYDEIAERFGLSEPTVRSLLHRARRTLRREYAARGGTLPMAGVMLALAPWRDGLHGLARLREVAKQSLAPVTASAAALTVVGVTAVFIGPADGARGADVFAAASPSARPAAKSEPARIVAHKQRKASAPVARPTDTAPVASAAPTKPRQQFQITIPRRCVGDRGINCTPPDPDNDVLWIGGNLPQNPTRLRELGISSKKVDCTRIPQTKLTHCVAGTSSDDEPSTTDDPSSGPVLGRSE